MKKVLWRIKYYINRVKVMNFDKWFEEIQSIHERSGKNRLWLLMDMVISSFRYGSGYVDYSEFEFYNLNHKQKSTYLTQTLSDRVDKKYNDRKYKHFFDDKGEFARKFKDYLGREIIDLRTINVPEFERFMKKHKRAIAKAFDKMAGQGISLVESDEVQNYEELYNTLMTNHQYVVEEFFIQHLEMAKLSVKSVNTIRMITFKDDNEQVHLLVSALKGGTDGIIDNIGQGGMYTILSETGKIIYPMIDQDSHTYTVHPNTHFELIGFQVPFFDKAIEMVKEAALVVPQIRYVGWDVAIGPDGPILIEGNSYSGPFQVIPSISKDKTGILPLYEKYMGKLGG